jgi:hypothetical protein
MNQGALSKIVLLTLKMSYELGAAYSPGQAFLQAAEIVTCPAMAFQLEKNLPDFMDKGLDVLTAEEKRLLKEIYSTYLVSPANFTAQAAQEIIDWLEGRYTVTRDLFLTQ